jgi:hypothetical protein
VTTDDGVHQRRVGSGGRRHPRGDHVARWSNGGGDACVEVAARRSEAELTKK